MLAIIDWVIDINNSISRSYGTINSIKLRNNGTAGNKGRIPFDLD